MPRPYGPVGLAISLVIIVLLALIYFMALMGSAALIEVALQGRGHLVSLVRGLREAVASGASRDWLLALFAIGLLLYAALLAAILTLAVWRGGGQWRALVAWTPWSPQKARWSYWALVAGGVAYGLAASIAVSLAYPQASRWSQFPHGAVGVLASYLLVSAAAPLTEELAFRGWIFTSLRSRLTFWPANLISGAAFAVAHWERTHLYAVAVFPLGLMLGLARERTGSVRASAAFHALYNTVALTLALLGPS